MATVAATPLTAPSSQNRRWRGIRRCRHPPQAAHSPASSSRNPRPTITSKHRWISHTTGGRAAAGPLSPPLTLVRGLHPPTHQPPPPVLRPPRTPPVPH